MAVRVGVIGVGLWGTMHVEAYQGLPHVEVVAVADADARVAERVAATHGISRWFADHRELCALQNLDAVSIVTPEAEHLGPVLAAAQAGKHILVEKPMASTVADAVAIVNTARQADVLLMPGHILRFEDRYAVVHEKLASGDLGRVVTIQARRNRTKLTRRKYARAHPVFAVAVHDIDLLLWYSGAHATRVRAWQRNITGGPTPDVFWGVVEFDNGILGILESTWLTPDAAGIPSDDVLHLITERGVASLDFSRDGLSVWTESGYTIPDVTIAPRIRGRIAGALASELSYFAACAQTRQQPQVVRGEDAVEGIRVAAALVESAEKGKEIGL